MRGIWSFTQIDQKFSKKLVKFLINTHNFFDTTPIDRSNHTFHVFGVFSKGECRILDNRN